MIPYIHAASTVVRGIENGKLSVHASNMGPSVIADATGKILAFSAYRNARLIKSSFL